MEKLSFSCRTLYTVAQSNGGNFPSFPKKSLSRNGKKLCRKCFQRWLYPSLWMWYSNIGIMLAGRSKDGVYKDGGFFQGE